MTARADDGSALRGALRLVALSVLGWAVVGTVLALFLAPRFAPDGAAPRSVVVLPTLLYVGLWAVATPPLLALADRLRPRAPLRRLATLVRAAGVALAIVVTAVLHGLAYAWLVRHLGDAGAVANIPDAALFFIGRFGETVAIGVLLVAGGAVARYRACVRRQELDRARLAAELAESRLHALGMELRPHFLFNTLNAIAGMVWEDPAKADAMVLQLSELLRSTLDSGDDPVGTLAEECRLLALYLEIQQVRFGERLTTRVDVPATLHGAAMPRFLLQPLVENAFEHGFASKRGRVSLDVRAAREGDRLVLRVLDDGAGLPRDGHVVESTGVGNARRRLATLYGASQSLTLQDRPSGGVEVVVTLPYRELAPAAGSLVPPSPDIACAS